MRTKTIKRTGKIRQVKSQKSIKVVIDDKKLAEFVASKMYKVTISFNMKTFECETDDLKTAILQIKPDQLLTEMYLKIEKGIAVFEKRFNLVQGRKLFNDEQQLDILLNTYNALYNG